MANSIDDDPDWQRLRKARPAAPPPQKLPPPVPERAAPPAAAGDDDPDWQRLRRARPAAPPPPPPPPRVEGGPLAGAPSPPPQKPATERMTDWLSSPTVTEPLKAIGGYAAEHGPAFLSSPVMTENLKTLGTGIAQYGPEGLSALLQAKKHGGGNAPLFVGGGAAAEAGIGLALPYIGKAIKSLTGYEILEQTGIIDAAMDRLARRMAEHAQPHGSP